MERIKYCTIMKLAIGLLLLGLIPGISSAVDHKYSIPVPGVNAEVGFTSVYNLEQRGNTFYTQEGDPVIKFKFGVDRGDNFFLNWATEANVLSRATENSPPVRYVRESPHGFPYVRGYAPVGTYTNSYGDPVMAYMEAGLLYGSKEYKGKNITFAMTVVNLDGIGRTLESAWIHILPTAEERKLQDGVDRYTDGVFLARDGKHDEALKAFNEAIKLNPTIIDCWGKRGYSLLELGKHSEAIKSYDEAIRLQTADKNASRRLEGTSYAIVSTTEATANVSYQESNLCDLWTNRGNVFMDQDKYDEAIKSYDEAIGFNPDNAITYNNKGYALLKQGNLNESINTTEEAIRLKPEFSAAWMHKGMALNELEKYNDSIICFDKAIEYSPDFAEIYAHKSEALSALGLTSEAEAASAKAEELGYTED